ncbi:MAG: hydrogenase nickel incorporation protein HypA [Beggiatoa sp. IS2]|nr:MAG: hydrogenase nickel incorporation protein HypA [Beggiatoa sp. IS2]
MHEFSICQALLTQVETLAHEHHARYVARIVVRVGPLCGIVPELLTHAFTLACVGTLAETAELVIESLPVRVRCQQCGVESEVIPNRLLCGACGDWHTQLLSGDEMLLASVELMTAEQ